MICFQLNLLKPFKSFQHQFIDLWYQLLYEIKSKFTVWFEWPIEMSDLKFSKYWHLIEKWTLTRKRGSRFGYITSVISIQRLWFAAINSFQNATTTRYLGQMINSTEMWIMFWSSCDFRFFKRFSVGEFFLICWYQFDVEKRFRDFGAVECGRDSWQGGHHRHVLLVSISKWSTSIHHLEKWRPSIHLDHSDSSYSSFYWSHFFGFPWPCPPCIRFICSASFQLSFFRRFSITDSWRCSNGKTH